MLNRTQKYKVLRGIVTPRPWPIKDMGKGDHMLNCGPHKIFCHDRTTLEFIQTCVELCDELLSEKGAEARMQEA